jgi:hypothetical protein
MITTTAIKSPTKIKIVRFCRASFRPRAICFLVCFVSSDEAFRFFDDFAI